MLWSMWLSIVKLEMDSVDVLMSLTKRLPYLVPGLLEDFGWSSTIFLLRFFASIDLFKSNKWWNCIRNLKLIPSHWK